LHFCSMAGGTALLVLFLMVDAATSVPLSGRCNITWTSHDYKYILPMFATWASSSLEFSWVAPFKRRAGTEFGQGYVVVPPADLLRWRDDGQWEVMQVIANTFLPDGSPSCCCEYLSGPRDAEFPVTLSDYCITSGAEHVSKACSNSSLAQLACPSDNATAAQRLGLPYSEQYSECASELVFFV